MAYIGRNPAIGTQKVLDSLESQFNGTLTTFDLRYNSNTIYPPIASALIVSLGGVLQEPGVAYTVASDTITFATAPPTGADCWILLYTEFGAMAGGSANFTVSNNLTIGNELHGPANFVIDPATIGDNTGTVEIKGNLTVQGTQTTVNSTTVDLDHLSLGDDEIANFGTDNDIQIVHESTGNKSVIKRTTTGDLYIQGASGSWIHIEALPGESSIKAAANGTVELYYDNGKKLETTNTGVTVTGDLTADSITIPDGNTSIKIGHGAGTNTTVDNIAIGDSNTLSSNTTGFNNLAVGGGSLVDNTVGEENTAIGYNAGYGLSGLSSDRNTAVGYGAIGAGAATGANNTTVGAYSLEDLTSGSGNTGIGNDAGQNITTGSNNVSVGYDSLENLTTGSNNIGLGKDAGNGITTGSNNIIIGNGLSVNLPSNLSDTVIIAPGGTERLRINSSGHVGVGTDAPDERLHVTGGSLKLAAISNLVFGAAGATGVALRDETNILGGSLDGSLGAVTMSYLPSAPSSPVQGQFYFNSLNQKAQIYTGSAFVDLVPSGGGGGGGAGTTDAQATFRKYTYTLTSATNAISGSSDTVVTAGDFVVGNVYTIKTIGTTDFTAIGASANTVGVEFTATGAGTGTGDAYDTLYYSTGGIQNIEAYVNGVKSVEGSSNDYVATTGTSVNFTSNLASGDVVDIQVYELLTNDAYVLASGGTFTGNVGINTSTINNRLHIHSDANEQGILLTQGGDNYSAIISNANRSGADKYVLNLEGQWNGSKVARIALETGDDTTNKDDGRIKFFTSAASGNPGVAMRIEPDKKIGVGGDHDPLSPLHIRVNTASLLRLERIGNTNAVIRYENDTSAMFAGLSSSATFFGIGTSENIASTTTQLCVTRADGNVGIGDTDPMSKLEVVGDITITNGDQNNAIRTNAAGQLQFLRNAPTNNTVAVTIDDETGYVGIGIDSPVNLLQLGGGDATLDNNKYIGFNIYNDGAWKQVDTGNGAVLKHHNTHGFQIYTGADSGNGAGGAANVGARFTVADAGNVGVGTNTPDAKFHVNGGSIRVHNTTSSTYVGGDHGRSIEIGVGLETSDAKSSFIDFHAADEVTGHSDHSYRIERDSGANGNIKYQNKGTGHHSFQQNGTTALRLYSDYVDVPAGPIYFTNHALISSWDGSGISGSNIDHIWHDDASEFGADGSWVFNSDSSYKSEQGEDFSNIKVGHVYVNNGNLGTTAGDTQDLARFFANNGNATSIRLQAKRKVAGTNWNSAGYKIFCHTDATEQGYIEFNPHTTTAGDGNYEVAIGSNSGELVRFKNNGNVGIGTLTPQETLHIEGNIQINEVKMGALVTPAINDDSYYDVTVPNTAGLMIITPFSGGGFPDYPQPQGSGMVWYDVGLSRNAYLIDSFSGSTLEVLTNTTSTTITDMTDGALTVAPLNSTTNVIRLFNRVGGTNSGQRRYKLVFL